MYKQLDLIGFTKIGVRLQGQISKRVPVPLSVQSACASALVFDRREVKNTPRLVEIYVQMLECGLKEVETEIGSGKPFPFSETDLAIGSNTEDVLSIPENMNDRIRDLFNLYNEHRQANGKKRLRSVVSIIVAMIRMGCRSTPLKTVSDAITTS
jgi:hypothetical protein